MSVMRINQQQQNEKQQQRLDILSFTTNFPKDYLPYTSSYHRKAPYLVWSDHRKVPRRKFCQRCLAPCWAASTRWARSPALLPCVTGAGVALVLAIIAFSSYLAWLTHFRSLPVLSLSGKLRVIEGDEFSPSLLNMSSPGFQAKAAKYEELLKTVYSDSNLQNSLVKVQVYAFREGSLVVYFNVLFEQLQASEDRSLHSKATEILIQSLEQSNIFMDLKIDKQSLVLTEAEPLEVVDNNVSGEPELLNVAHTQNPLANVPVSSNSSPTPSATSTLESTRDLESTTVLHTDTHQGTDKPFLLTYGPWTPMMFTSTSSPTDKIITVLQPMVASDYPNLRNLNPGSIIKQTSQPLDDTDNWTPGFGPNTEATTKNSSVRNGAQEVVINSASLLLRKLNETRGHLNVVSGPVTTSQNSGLTSTSSTPSSTTRSTESITFENINPVSGNAPESTTDEYVAVSVSHSVRTEIADPVTIPTKGPQSQTRFLPDISVGVPLVIRGSTHNGEVKPPTLRRIQFGTKDNAPHAQQDQTSFTKTKTTQSPSLTTFEISVEAGLSLKGTGTVGQGFVVPISDDLKPIQIIPQRVPKPLQPPLPIPQPEIMKDLSTELTVGASLFIRNGQDKLKSSRPILPIRSKPSTISNTIPTSPRPVNYQTTYLPPQLTNPELTINAPLYIRGTSKGQAYIPLIKQGLKTNEKTQTISTESTTSNLVSSPTVFLKPPKGETSDDNVHQNAGGIPKIISQYIPFNGGYDEPKKPNYNKDNSFKDNPGVNNFYEKPVQTFDADLKSESTTTVTLEGGHDIFTGTTNDIVSSTKPSSITKPPKVLVMENENDAGSGLDVISMTIVKECDNLDEFQCSTGTCIDKTKLCNRLKDCPDASDETNCSCADYLRTRIFRSKICDGIVDCWDFSDEMNCAWCSTDQFICPGAKLCIPHSKVCDDVPDCPAGEDESHCVKLSKDTSLGPTASAQYKRDGYLLVRRRGQWGKVCVDNFPMTSENGTVKWTLDELGHSICNSLSFKGMSVASRTSDHFSEPMATYFQLREPSSTHNLLSSNGVQKTTCPSKDVLKISCNSLECGLRPLSLGFRRRIVGGHSSTFGSWPWQVALYKEGDFQCGAVIVNDQWLVSAGHCFYHSKDAHWTARLGLLRRGSEIPSPFEQIRNITHIFLHPQYVDRGFINDIVLLRMDRAVDFRSVSGQFPIFSDHIRPLCLPEPVEDISSWEGQLCTAVGWGKLFEVGRIFPDTLQEVQLPIISTEECRKRTLFLPLYRITDNMFCAGFERGGRDACLGDSGGPLMCQRGNGRWALVGVTSNGDGCGRPGRPGVYTKVANYLPWITSIMGQFSRRMKISCFVENPNLPAETTIPCDGHRCALGKCLTAKRICDGAWDCWDGSDEKNC